MAAMRVIPPLDELEDCYACLDLGFEAAAVEQFAFERGKEASAHRVIEAIADGTQPRKILGGGSSFICRLVQGAGGSCYLLLLFHFFRI